MKMKIVCKKNFLLKKSSFYKNLIFCGKSIFYFVSKKQVFVKY